MKYLLSKFSIFILAAALLLITSASAFSQANIVIQNTIDGAGVGFNDTTAAAPIGGNSGTTVGQQRLIAFQAAANIWAASLNSNQTITVSASWADLPCTATSGTLGSAGPTGSTAVSSSSSGMVPNRWYPIALAEALSNTNRNATSAEISARFNQKLGQPGCLETQHWYYGLDNNHGSAGVDLVSVLVHEFGHGLGFLTTTNTSTGAFLGTAPNSFPSIWDDFLFDNSTSKTWAQMTDSERVASAKNNGHLVWKGPQVLADVPIVLSGTPRLRINSPGGIAGLYQVFSADFGPSLSPAGITANVVQAVDPADGAGASTTDGCSAFTNAAAISGRIALIDRGTCTFITKTRNAQNAGAVGVIIADNAGNPNGPLAGLGGGPDNTITIPAVGVSVADGNTIKGQLSAPSVNATLFSDQTVLGGTDASGRPLMYTPATLAPGSSVSHWDTSLTPNQVMEPNISSNLFHRVSSPLDLTLSLLKDIGWPSNASPAATLLLEQGTTAAAAVDSVTFVRGPFSVLNSHNFSVDGHSRLVFLTTDLGLNPSDDLSVLAVQANGIPLTVEAAGPNSALPGTSYVVVRLPDLLQGNYSLTVSLRGVNSTNTPTITIVP